MSGGPGSKYVEIPAAVLEECLQKAGFTRTTFAREVVYVRAHNRCQHTTVKVYTSLPANGDVARACGADAIRVIARFERATGNSERARGFQKCIHKGKRVHRMGTVEKVLERMLERAREAYAACNEFLKDGGCFACCKPQQRQDGGQR